jgi:putative ABC transport system permease protein
MKYLYFILKNITRKKVRTTLTILSITIAFLLFGLLRSLSAAFNAGADIAGEDRLISINKVALIQPLHYHYLAKVRAVSGVESVTMASWFGGYYQDPKNQFPIFPVEAQEYFDIYKDLVSLPPDQLENWKRNRIGAVVGRGLADKFHWKIGDRIPIMGNIFPQKSGSFTWEFIIEGIYSAKTQGADTGSMLFHHEYFDEGRQFGEGNIGWMIIKVKNPKQSEQVAAAIDALFANSDAETKTSSEKDFAKSFAKQFGDIGLITTLILGAVFFTMLLVAGNTMAQSFRERIPEFAILKTLGFSDVAVMLMVLAEALLVCGIGGLLGLLLAKAATEAMATALAATLPGLVMSWNVLGLGLLLVAGLGLVTGLVPALQGLRLNIINALRRN